MKMPAWFLFFNFVFSLFFSLLVTPSNTFAATFFDRPIPSGQYYQVVNESFCSGPTECANSQNTGNCGLPACTAGNAWTKYELTCLKYQPPFEDPIYDEYYVQGGIMYSIGDKCVSGEPGLRSSNCTGIQSTNQYKTCCTNTTPSYAVSATESTTNPKSCVQSSGDTTNPPWEGSCPTGSTAKFCGFDTNPACGQAACGSTVTQNPPAPVCTAGATQACTDSDTNCPGQKVCLSQTNDWGVCEPNETVEGRRCLSYTCTISAQSTGSTAGTSTLQEQNNDWGRYDRTNWFMAQQGQSETSLGTNTNLTYQFTNLTPGTQYTIRAERYSSTGKAPTLPCGTATLTTPLDLCTLIPNPNPAIVGQQVTWGLVGPLTGTSATWTNLDNNLVTTTIPGPSPGSNNTNQWTDTKTYNTQGTYQRQASIKNSSGTEICAPQASVTINPATGPTGQCGVTLSSSSSSITAGAPLTLSWSSTDGTGGTARTASLVASGSWSGSKTPLQNGSTTYQNLAGPTIYTFDLTCYDGEGRAGNTATATVSVLESQVTSCNDRAHACGTNNYGLLPDPTSYCGTTQGTDVRWAYANDNQLDTACQTPNNGGKDYCYACYRTPQGATTTPSAEPAPLKPPAPLLTFSSTFWNAPFLARIFEDRDETGRYQTLVTDPDILTGFFGGIRWGSGCRYDFSRPCPGRVCSTGFISDFELVCSPGNVATPINLTTGSVNILKGSPVYNIAKQDPVFGLYSWEANQDYYSEKRTISYTGSQRGASVTSNFIKLNTGTSVAGDQVNNKTTTSISPFDLSGLFGTTVTREVARWCGGYSTNYQYYRCGFRTESIGKSIIPQNTTNGSCQNGCTLQSRIEYPGSTVSSYRSQDQGEGATYYPDADCQGLSDSCSPGANPQTCNLVTSDWFAYSDSARDQHYASCSLTRYQKNSATITPWSLTIATPPINNVEETATNLSAQNKGWTDLFEVPASYNTCMVQTRCTGQQYSCLWNEVTPKYIPGPDCPAGKGPNPEWTNYDGRCSYEYRNTNCSCSFDLYCFEDGCFRASQSYDCSLPLKTAYQNFNLTPPGKYLFEMKIKPRSVKSTNVQSGTTREVSDIRLDMYVEVGGGAQLLNAIVPGIGSYFSPDANLPGPTAIYFRQPYDVSTGGTIKIYLTVPIPTAGTSGPPVTIKLSQQSPTPNEIMEIAFDPPTLTALGWTEGSLPFGRTGNSYIENLNVSVSTSTQLNTVVGIKNQSLNPPLTCPPAGSDNFCSKDNTAYTVVSPEKINMLDVLLGKPPPPLPAWLKVVGGDVHSNVKIESPGGPRP